LKFNAVMAIDPAKVKAQVEANNDYLINKIGHTAPELLAASDEILTRC
jgi:phosphoenolpyruvate carboxykinase (GTP)